MLYPYNGILLEIKRNKLLLHTITWINLKITMLSERIQIKNNYDSTYIKFWEMKTKAKENRFMIAWDREI